MSSTNPDNHADPSDVRLIFLHIPKTGGTTLMKVLEQAYPGRTHYMQNAIWTEQREALANLGIRLQRARVFMGHTPFGIHEVIPQSCRYIVVLRHPGARIVSLYHHIAREPKHHLYNRVIGRGMSLADFGSSHISAAVDNYQTRVLAGGERGFGSRPGECPHELLGLARTNLQHPGALIGLQESLDAFIARLGADLAWKRVPEYTPLRVTSGIEPFSELDESTQKAIEQANALDMALYNDVRTGALATAPLT